MLSINITADILRFQGKEFAKDMNERLEKLHIDAIRAFLQAALRRTPVRTGFLRGAYGAVEDTVGAFEFTTSFSKKPRTRLQSVKPRPGRDIASKTLSFVKLRNRQRKVLERLQRLREEESNRFTAEDGLTRSRADQEIRIRQITEAGAQARRQRRRLLKEATENDRKITELAETLEKKLKFNLGPRLGDRTRAIQTKLEVARAAREEKFLRILRRLRRRVVGETTPRRYRNFNGRVPYTITPEQYTALSQRIRRIANSPSKKIQQLERDLNNVLSPKIKEEINTSIEKIRERLSELKKRKKLSADEFKDKIIKAERFVKTQALEGSPFLDLFKEEQRIRKLRLRRLSRQAQVRQDYLNYVAKVKNTTTGRTRIAGQSEAGKFDLRPGERVDKAFKLLEYYYYGPKQKVLKTPRSGRQFASKAPVLERVKEPVKSYAPLFRQVSSILRAYAPDKLKKEFEDQGRELQNITTKWVFNFSINIRYLPINDVKLLWGSWNAGILAYTQHINGNLLKRIPKVEEYMVTETRTLNGTRSTRSAAIKRPI